MAHARAELGSRRAFVVHGDFDGVHGLDEISTTGVTEIAEVKDGKVRLFTMTPEEAGLPRASPADLLGGTLGDNVRMLRDLLDGARGPRRDIVFLNAAAALIAAGRAADWQEGIRLAAHSVDSGAAKNKLFALTEFSTRFSPR